MSQANSVQRSHQDSSNSGENLLNDQCENKDPGTDPEPSSSCKSFQPSSSKQKKSEASRTNNRKFRVNQATFPLKVTLFLSYGAVSAIAPYLTIHMQDLGISIEEVAVIYAILPFTSFVGPLLLGGLADKLGNYRWILVCSAIGTGFCHTMLLYVPSYKENVAVYEEAQVRWIPILQKGFLTPKDPLHHCNHHVPFLNSTMDAIELGTLVNASFCQPVASSHSKFDNTTNSVDLAYQSDLIRSTSLLFLLEQKFNCSANLDEIGDPWLKLHPDLKLDQEFLCSSNIKYFTGQKTNIGNNSTTFWIYFILRIISTIFLVSFLSLMDATTLAVVKRCGKAEYGRERIWSILGSAIVSPIAGTLVDRISHTKGFTDYSPAFYLCDVLLICCIFSFFFVQMKVDKSETGLLKNAWKLAKYPEVLIFLLMIFLLGNLWGFVESYLFIFLKELSAPNFLLGLTLTVGSLTGMPFLWGSESIVNKFGRVNLIIAAFITYFIRFFGYSYLQDPFWCFPFEAMEAFTVHLMWAAAATYCSLLAPKGMLASLMSVMGSLHYSLGKGAGSFLGGIAYGAVGARLAFRYFGISAGLAGILFFTLDFIWIRKLIEKRLEKEKSQFDEAGGKEISFHNVSITRRPSIFDANPFSKTTAVISLDENYDDDEVDEEMETLPETVPAMVVVNVNPTGVSSNS